MVLGWGWAQADGAAGAATGAAVALCSSLACPGFAAGPLRARRPLLSGHNGVRGLLSSPSGRPAPVGILGRWDTESELARQSLQLLGAKPHSSQRGRNRRGRDSMPALFCIFTGRQGLSVSTPMFLNRSS